jgi:hypothetical protein
VFQEVPQQNGYGCGSDSGDSNALDHHGDAEGLVGRPVTTAVAADDAVAEPAELLAVRETRIVDPTSMDPRRKLLPAAPATGTQEAPLELHRCH